MGVDGPVLVAPTVDARPLWHDNARTFVYPLAKRRCTSCHVEFTPRYAGDQLCNHDCRETAARPEVSPMDFEDEKRRDLRDAAEQAQSRLRPSPQANRPGGEGVSELDRYKAALETEKLACGNIARERDQLLAELTRLRAMPAREAMIAAAEVLELWGEYREGLLAREWEPGSVALTEACDRSCEAAGYLRAWLGCL